MAFGTNGLNRTEQNLVNATTGKDRITPYRVILDPDGKFKKHHPVTPKGRGGLFKNG